MASADPPRDAAAPAPRRHSFSVSEERGGAGAGERGGDDTVTTGSRRRAPSPIATGQDAGRPFAFKRQSSGFSAFINSIASPTSEVRTRPATPAESATRSTFFTGTAITTSPPATSTPAFSASPTSTLTRLDIPAGPVSAVAAGPVSARLKEDRPKGAGTLELERVLGMWAAQTPTNSSFPALPSLPVASASTVPPSSQPLFPQALVTAEPESLDLATAAQTDVSTTSSSFSSVFADFAHLAALQPSASSSRDQLELPHIPRRQRSKSEADIMSLDFSFPSFFPATSAAGQPIAMPDFGQRAPPQLSQAILQSLLDTPLSSSSDAWRQTGAPTAYTVAPPVSSATFQTHVTAPARPPFPQQRSAGNLQSFEAESADRGRRARSQGLGHRRSAKSDDLTHLLAALASSQAGLAPQQPAYSTANGHLAPPGGASVPSASPAPSSQGSHSPFPLASLPQQGSPQPPQQQYVYVPPGQPVPVAYLTTIDPITGTPVLTAVPSPQAPQQQLPPRHSPQPPQHQQLQPPPQHQQQQQAPYPPQAQYSPQSNALALAAAQAHAAQVAQATAAAAAAAALQYSSTSQARPAGRASIASAHSDASPGGALNGHAPSPALSAASAPYHLGGQRTPYLYHSPLPQLPQAPSPASQAGAVANGRNPAVSNGAGGRKRTRGAAKLEDEDETLAEEDEEDDAMREDPLDEEDEDDDDDELDDGDYVGPDGAAAGPQAGARDLKLSPAVRAPAVSRPRKKVGGAAKKARSGARAGNLDEDEFSKESKTTQATIDAAKKRRNANAVAKFVCELCGETFTRRYNLRGHQRAHKGEKPYKCGYDGCDKSFARAHDCKRHELLHLGVRKYHCSPCKRDFVRLDALHRHHRSEVGQACVKQLQAEGALFDEKGAQIIA
ncbi:uncharacterized protein JCM10292_006715 [Rhodotorula paludigena]|uniref:uncharacterized protein n=1 Tax=Rhodotorula paludigena TaxID=86838 RepID=UPI00317DA015